MDMFRKEMHRFIDGDTSRETVYFIGIDLAFSSKNNSGVSILSGTQHGDLRDLGYIKSRLCKTYEEIAEFILPYLIPGCSVVAVDAPLVVPNATGMRPCEREVARTYGNRQCAAYPAHQGNMAGTRGPNLLAYLESIGVPVVANPVVDRARPVVHFMETYPHAAHLEMFCLPTVWKYKKKGRRSWASCRSELVAYWKQIGSLMPGVVAQVLRMSETDALGQRLADWTTAIREDGQPPEVIGKRYKEFEDLTDGLFCAYIAAHIDAGKPAILFSPAGHGPQDLSRYRAGDDFIVVPASD